MDTWNWLLHSDAGLLVRVGIGVAIFAALAIADLRKNGRRATRWREYVFLLGCTLAAMAYGALNDQVTSSVSWEYFYYGKGLAEQLGPRTPPDGVRLHLAAAVVGIKATWTAGLILGVCLLVANNPSARRARLPYVALWRGVGIVLWVTVLVSAVGAAAGYAGLPARWNEDFAEMLRRDEMRPRRFMAVYGIHMGGYVGGALGTMVAMGWVYRRRGRIDVQR